MEFELIEYYHERPNGTAAEFSAQDIASAMRRASELIEKGGSRHALWVLYDMEGKEIARYSRGPN